MMRLDEILDNKLAEVTKDAPEVKGEQVVQTVGTDNPEQFEGGKKPEEAKQEVKTGPQYDGNGKLILTNDHIHNMAANLHGTMAAVAKMQATMDALLKSHAGHIDQTKLHEEALIQSIKHHNNHEQQIQSILKSK